MKNRKFGKWWGGFSAFLLVLLGAVWVAGCKHESSTDEGKTPVITGISIKTNPTKTEYAIGEKFDPSGLVITAKWSEGKADTEISYSESTKKSFTFSPSLDASLTVDDKKVTVTYEGKQAEIQIKVSSPLAGAIMIGGGDNAVTVTINPDGETGKIGDKDATIIKNEDGTITIKTDDKSFTAQLTEDGSIDPGKISKGEIFDENQIIEATIEVTSVKISNENLTLQLKSGESVTQTLEATLLPENATNKEGATFNWEVSGDAVTISQTNSNSTTVEAKNEGSATITVTATIGEKTFTDTCQVTVQKEALPPSGDSQENPVGDGTGSLSGISTTPGSDSSIGTESDAQVSNATSGIKIVKSGGRLNSAYIIFEKFSDADSYEVLCDDKKIDDELIRFYDQYVYYTKTEDASLKVAWEKHTISNVVRADALGLKKGSHTIKVRPIKNGIAQVADYSTSQIDVLDNDRQGFCFTKSATPGAYNADGTLKNGAIVIYLTEQNKTTVKAKIGSEELTGIANITQAVKTKNLNGTPVCIRVIGKLTLSNLSCNDMSSAYALGVKDASYVTIEGVGDDATMNAGVAAFKSEYIEIANLGLMKWGGGKDGDGVSLKESKYVWVHNNDFFYGDAGSDADQKKGDGSMDLKDNSQYVTISYNHFWDSGKMSLCGMKNESGPNYITYHHNWFDHSDSRHPRVRTMSVHVYNNYFDGNAKYGIGVTSGGNIFAEGNFFRNAHNPMMISGQGTDAQGQGTFSGESGGQIKSFNNKFDQNNTNGVKFQFITNKWDYTNNTELGEYKEWTEDVGTQNAGGTWTIYEAKITDSSNGIQECPLIFIEDATLKSGYYQVSKGKTAFILSVPSSTTKVIINAKTGSSGASGDKLKVGSVEANVPANNADYGDCEFAISGLSGDSLLEVVNTSSHSINIKSIKVIASSSWTTKLTSGADLSNIDAFEVDKRNQTIAESVTSRKGGHKYSNFDATLGDSGLGLKTIPTDPDTAKSDVLAFAGRIEPNYAWNFNNETDDKSYDVNDTLNSELVAYISSGPAMTHLQGTSASSGGSSGSSSGDGSDGSGTGSEGGTTGGDSSGGSGEGGTTGGDSGGSGSGSGDEELTAIVAGSYSLKTSDKVFSKQNAGASQTKNGIFVSCKIDSAGANLKISSGAQQGIIMFKVDSPMTLVVTNDASNNGVCIASSDGTAKENDTQVSVSELPTATNSNFTDISGKTISLTSGTYKIGALKGSSAKISKLVFSQ